MQKQGIAHIWAKLPLAELQKQIGAASSFMGVHEMERQSLNGFRMKLMGVVVVEAVAETDDDLGPFVKGVELVRDILDSGAAGTKLEELAQFLY